MKMYRKFSEAYDRHPVVIMVVVGVVLNLLKYLEGVSVYQLVRWSLLVMFGILFAVLVTVVLKRLSGGRWRDVFEVRVVSTHAAGGVSACLVTGWLYGGVVGLVVGVVLGMVLGYSRVYIGRHTVGQVIYGSIVGIMVFMVVVFINKYCVWV